jgi:hypothetical protein
MSPGIHTGTDICTQEKEGKVSPGRAISARDVGSKQSESELPIAGTHNSSPGAPRSLLMVGSHGAEVLPRACLTEGSRERSLLHGNKEAV